MNQEDLKRVVGERAAELVVDGMVIGLGTGSTVRYLLEALSARRARGELKDIVGIPTSEDTRRRAESLGIPLTDFEHHPALDLALDGADEVDPALNLIKGHGGALLREKVVVTAAKRFIVLVDATKCVDRLGSRLALPVEVDPFSVGMQLPFLESLGCTPRTRLAENGEARATDGGHVIVDCHFPDGITDPVGLAAVLDSRPGIFEHGLFLGCVERVLVGTPGGVEVLQSPGAGR